MNTQKFQSLDCSKNFSDRNADGSGISRSGGAQPQTATDKGSVIEIVDPSDELKIKVSDRQNENSFYNSGNRVYGDAPDVCSSPIKPRFEVADAFSTVNGKNTRDECGLLQNEIISLSGNPLVEGIDQFAVPANTCMVPMIKMAEICKLIKIDNKSWGFQSAFSDDQLTIGVTAKTTTNLLCNLRCEGSNDYEKLKDLEIRKNINVLECMTFFLFSTFDRYFEERQIYPSFT